METTSPHFRRWLHYYSQFRDWPYEFIAKELRITVDELKEEMKKAHINLYQVHLICGSSSYPVNNIGLPNSCKLNRKNAERVYRSLKHWGDNVEIRCVD